MSEAGRRGIARTAPASGDARLRGLTCAVPFEDVWQSARRLADGGIRGWSLEHADDQEGIIRAGTRSLRGAEHDVEVRISLDANAQTRVDAVATARKPGTDFGAARRRVITFFTALDKRLAALPPRRPTPAP